MKIYLDTRDLINILERSDPCTPEEFDTILRTGDHQLIISFLNVIEISAPLLNRQAKTNVMRILNRIERLPIKYIAKIFKSELKEAYSAFTENREYQTVSPFADRFDETADDRDSPPTRIFLNFGLAETVFTLWTEDSELFSGFQHYMKRLHDVVSSDRALAVRPSLRENFVKTIGLQLQTQRITIPEEKLQPFAYWIYDVTGRCPGIRLGYELYHKFVRNVEDVPKEGDIPDFGHADCVPYVDHITLDRRMSSYAIQASKGLQLGYENRIFRHVDELLSELN
jgi:hypothetical protein